MFLRSILESKNKKWAMIQNLLSLLGTYTLNY